MIFNQDLITGTLIHYYVTCKREAWLYSRKISANQEDENILMGKALAEVKEKNLQEFPFSNLQFDRIGKQRGHYLITEYKKSMKNPEAAKMQLFFYMYLLKRSLKLKEVNGKVISGKKVVFVEGNRENFDKLELLLKEIEVFLQASKPPKVQKIVFCKSCGYKDYCF